MPILNLRHIYKRCLSLFWAILSAFNFNILKKRKREKRFFFQKFRQGIKNEEFYADFNTTKKYPKNVIHTSYIKNFDGQ